jgi:hypothetical protein
MTTLAQIYGHGDTVNMVGAWHTPPMAGRDTHEGPRERYGPGGPWKHSVPPYDRSLVNPSVGRKHPQDFARSMSGTLHKAGWGMLRQKSEPVIYFDTPKQELGYHTSFSHKFVYRKENGGFYMS